MRPAVILNFAMVKCRGHQSSPPRSTLHRRVAPLRDVVKVAGAGFQQFEKSSGRREVMSAPVRLGWLS
jgi:hypothetical protein